MTKNKSRKMQRAARLLADALAIDSDDPHALPGSVVKMVKDARRLLLRDIRKRREKRARERQ